MGLFDKLTKEVGGLKDKLEKATGIDLDETAGKIGDAAGKFGNVVKAAAEGVKEEIESQKAESAAAKPAAAATPAAAAAPAAARPADAHAFFDEILAAEFGGYTVQKATAAGIAAPAGSKPYDYALSRGGSVCGVIMLTPHNRDNNAAFKNARAAAEAAGVPFINFYTHMTNERGYVVSRIKRLLK